MADQIRELTSEALQAQARAAAEQCIPLEEACQHIAHDAGLAHKFAAAYEASIGEAS